MTDSVNSIGNFSRRSKVMYPAVYGPGIPEVVSTSETTCVSSLVYLGGAVDEFLWSVDVRSCGKLPNVGFAANEPLWMRDMRCVQNLLPSF